MTPAVQYFLALAQRAGNTPAGQRFLQMAQQAADKVRGMETRWPTMARGPGGQCPARTMPGDKLPVAPISRGLAGAAGAGAVAAGSGQFEGVRSRLYEGAEARPNIPGSRWGELDARGAGAPPLPMNYGRGDSPREMGAVRDNEWQGPPETFGPLTQPPMPREARAAVSTARSIVAPPPRQAPMPPPRPREGAPMMLPSSPDYQSNSRPVQDNAGINWGDPDSAADFFRAERAMRAGRAEGGGLGLMPPDMGTMPVDAPPPGMEMSPALPQPADAAPSMPPAESKGPSGGGAGGKDAAINKALDIIHKLIIRQGIA